MKAQGYKVFARKDNADKFVSVYEGKDITETAELSVEDIEAFVDYRVCILYSDGRVMPSNIVTLEKSKEEDKDEDGNAINDFSQISKDTDSDGLEDGYEIWDFKTLWNKETGVDKDGNKTYDLDTDDDGFPDSYEVFTLGTDPAVANEKDADSDGDSLSDYKEYIKGTDPYLQDSDFDNSKDDIDGTPRETNNYTRQAVASSAQVHKGMYDKEYSKTENGVMTTYIENIYRGNIKSTYYDYGDVNLNKHLKYFYDEHGNNTAIVEEYDEEYYKINGLKDSQTICITYTYDELGNTTFICDQSNRYTMDYGNDYNVDRVQIGTQPLIEYNETVLEDNRNDVNRLDEGDIISEVQNIATYGNGQKVKTITTEKKVEDDNTKSVEKEIVYYYNDETSVSYKTQYNSGGEVTKLYDYTGSTEVIYEYTHTDEGVKVERRDNFIKETTTIEDEENNQTTDSIKYTFNDVKGNETSYTYTVINDNEPDDSQSEMSASAILFNQDKINYKYSEENRNMITSLYSEIYHKNILNVVSTANSDLKTTYEIEADNKDKKIEYTYDLAGNITEIKVNNKKAYEYTYDAHGRLIVEKDYEHLTCGEYGYDETSNIQAIKSGIIDKNGTITSRKIIKYASYGNSQWSDQLTAFDGHTISYDAVGNPTTYINGETFIWSRGRQLSKVKLDDNSEIEYVYNQNGLRSYKNTDDVSIDYTWDDGKLIREQVTYKTTGTKYDVWYFYDSQDNVAGFEYSFIGNTNVKQKVRIYYEKNLQGDVIGLLDSRGVEIATYSYDAWGNVTETICYEGNEVPYNLNHIKYRGYYMDEETGFYYLQSRYYDSKICRFINSDDVNNLGSSGMVFGYNLYAYCESNPIRYTDATGKSIKSLWNRIKKYVRNGIRLGHTVFRLTTGINTAIAGEIFLDMWKDKSGIYHASFNGWQQYFGYNDFYDFMFDIGASMKATKFEFTCNKVKYVLWGWKGDYINLGAGGELGIYYGGGPHWKVNKKLAMKMSMTLFYKNKKIISYSTRTWWITGFNPKYQNISASNLRVTYKVYFNSYAMYSAFNKGDKHHRWRYNGHENSAYFSFKKM